MLTNETTNSLRSYILQLCKDYKIYLSSLFIISILASLFEILVHYKIKEMIDIIAAKEHRSMFALIGFFVLFKFLHHGMFFIHRIFNIIYKPTLNARVTSDIYQKTVQHSLHWFDSHMSGEIAAKISGFQLNLSNVITNIFRTTVVLWAIVIGMLFLLKVHYLAALVQLVFLLIYTPIILLILKKQLKLQEALENSSQETSGIINDSISNIFGIKVIGNVVGEFKLKLTPSILKRKGWESKVRKFDAFIVDNTDTLMIVLMSAVQISLLSYLYQHDQITAGGFAFVAMIMLKLHGDINSILDHILFNINPQIASIKASYKFINEKYDTVDDEKASKLQSVSGEIEFRNVSFAYKDANCNVLDNFNLKIKAGEKIGLVGHSGAGKTTLIKSLIRYFDVNYGAVLIDDNDLTKITQESLRANISMIPQDITMFHRTILENLRIAKSDATPEEIFAACKKAAIHDDILAMKNGYDSIVGERGVKVSGGQRQRIAIARAILKDAPILILDEATSALDSKTEKQIQQSLNLLIADNSKTVIAIAHRLSTLKHMDRIIVMDKGKIAEIGTHDELLQNNASLYKKLWELQEI
jgi:ATP-binding cassette, subfamily B, bacterial